MIKARDKMYKETAVALQHNSIHSSNSISNARKIDFHDGIQFLARSLAHLLSAAYDSAFPYLMTTLVLLLLLLAAAVFLCMCRCVYVYQGGENLLQYTIKKVEGKPNETNNNININTRTYSTSKNTTRK